MCGGKEANDEGNEKKNIMKFKQRERKTILEILEHN